MRRAILCFLLLSAAIPAAAEQVAECRSIGGHHPFGNDISAARYVRLYGSKMVLTGRTGHRDMPTWSLPCASTEKGLFCSANRRGTRVNIVVDGWQMKEMVWRHGYQDEIFHVVYNCNHELALP